MIDPETDFSIPTSRLLTVADVAECLRVNAKTVRRWIATGELPAYKVGRQWRVAEEDLWAFLAKHRCGG